MAVVMGVFGFWSKAEAATDIARSLVLFGVSRKSRTFQSWKLEDDHNK